MKTDSIWTSLDRSENCNQCARVVDAGESIVDVQEFVKTPGEFPGGYWRTRYYLCPTCEDPSLG